MGQWDAVYLTTDEFKARTRSGTTANDAAIAAVLAAASRQVDRECGRGFGKSAAPEARAFDGWTWPPDWRHYPPSLALGDVVSVSAIASDDGSRTYPTAWDAATYRLLPLSAPIKGRPYREIAPPPGIFWVAWPTSFYGVQVTGVFGWPSVPNPIKEATFLIANRLKSLWDAPFGLSGGGEMGSLDMTTSLTPIIRSMLAPYKVMPV